MYLDQFISEALNEPRAAMAYHVSRRLAALFPDRPVVEGDDCDFELLEYARVGGCALRREQAVHGQVVTSWDRDREGPYESPRQVWYEVDWQGHTLDVLLMTLEECCVPHYWIAAVTEAVARDFFAAVCADDREVRDEILVFDGGVWQGRAGLFREIQGAGFDGLVLAGTLKEDIRADVERFFASRATYEALGAPGGGASCWSARRATARRTPSRPWSTSWAALACTSGAFSPSAGTNGRRSGRSLRGRVARHLACWSWRTSTRW